MEMKRASGRSKGTEMQLRLLAGNMQTEIIPNLLKHFIFPRHSEPTATSLVIALADLLLGSLRLLLARELHDVQG